MATATTAIATESTNIVKHSHVDGLGYVQRSFSY
jgi:hypothetical protein